MSRGRMSFKPFKPVKEKGIPLLNPTKAREKGYLEIRAYDNKVKNQNNDLTK